MLTPEELVDYPLKLGLRGYSVEQVDDLLDRAADSMEQAHKRIAELEEQLAASERRLAVAAETEETLKRTLVTAQRAAEQSLEEAREHAARLVREAEEEARRHSLDAERRRRELEDHVAELRGFEAAYRAQLRELLEARLRELEDLGATVAPLGDGRDVPSDVADLVDLPHEHDDRPNLRVRVHEEGDGGPSDGGGPRSGSLAWPPSGGHHGGDAAPDPDTPGE